jgi:type II secretory pathway pseudopilin PulG
MGEKGFLLIEVLIGLFLFGIIVVICLPILGNSLGNIRLVKTKMDMVYVAESTMEQIKSFDYNFLKGDEYIFDMLLIELIDILMEGDSTSITLPLDEKDGSSLYTCTIYKENYDKNLWKVWIEVSPLEEANKIKNVKVVTIMPIPSQEENERE